MPAHEKVSLQQIVNAMLPWDGSWQAAADELGIRVKNLRERFEVAGLDISDFRKRDARDARLDRSARFKSHEQPLPEESLSESIPFTRAGVRRRLPSMNTAMATADIQSVAQRRRVTPRLRPCHLDRLTDARYDLQAILRADITESQILEMFLEDGLEKWLKAKVATLRKAEAEK